jgi:hypothetical protein
MDLGVVVFWAGLALLLLVALVLRRLEADRMAAKLERGHVWATKTPADAQTRESSSVVSGVTGGRPPRFPAASLRDGWKLVHTVRRGRVETVVWTNETESTSPGWHTVTFSQLRDAQQCDRDHDAGYGVLDCLQLIACVNEAISWIQRDDRATS